MSMTIERFTGRLFVWGALSLILSMNTYAFATEAVTDAELQSVLKNAKIVDPAFKLTASLSGDEVVITTQRKPKSTDSECKIQAALIGKTVFDTVSSDIQRTKVLFFDYDAGSYSEVSVKRAEVKLFGSGQLSEKELLASVELKTHKEDASDDETNVGVSKGPLEPERLIALGRIQRLQSNGTNVTPFKDMFNKVEDDAKADDMAATRKDLRDLNAHLKEQEQLAANAKQSEKSMQAHPGGRSGNGKGGGFGAGRDEERRPNGFGPGHPGGGDPKQKRIKVLKAKIFGLQYNGVNAGTLSDRLNRAIQEINNNQVGGDADLNSVENDINAAFQKMPRPAR